MQPIHTLPIAYRDDRQQIVSMLLDRLYPFTPSLENVDKLRSGHRTGAEIITYTVKQLFGNTLSKQNLPNKSYAAVIDGVLVQRWGLLTTSGNHYAVQEPKDRKLHTAWNRISELCDLGGQKERKILLGQIWREMLAAPYGYNELTFVALLGSWLAGHRQEVRIGVRVKKADGSPVMVEAPLIKFVRPDEPATTRSRQRIHPRRRRTGRCVSASAPASSCESSPAIRRLARRAAASRGRVRSGSRRPGQDGARLRTNELAVSFHRWASRQLGFASE